MTPAEHVAEAVKNLEHVERIWFKAEHNLVELQGGWPTGHQGSARLDDGKDIPLDPCREAMTQADRLIDAVLVLAGGFFALGTRRPADRGVRIHLATNHVRLLAHDLAAPDAALSRDGARDCRAIEQASVELARLADRWSFDVTTKCDKHKRPACGKCKHPDAHADGLGIVATNDWCANHQRFGIMEPVSLTAPEPLCDFCWSFVRGKGARPDERIIRKRHLRERITPRDLKAGA